MVVTAPGKRPATFRTWKLSPAAPMVLQPIGCGRVGHRHNTPKQERPETSRFLAAPSIHTPGPRHRPPREAPTRTRPQFDQPTPRDTTHQRTNVAHICPRDMGCLIHDSLMMEQLPGPCGTSGNLCPNQYRFVLHSYARTIHAALPHRAFPGPHAQACTRG